MDHTLLNRFVLRPTHPTRTPRDADAEIDSEANFFTCFDAANSYYQILLHPSSQILTTFMTLRGRFKFLRLSMGLSCSDKEYNRRADMAFVDQINTLHVVDDLLRFDRDFPADVKRRMRPPSGGPEGRHHFKSREVSVRPVKGVVGGIRDPTWRGQLHG